MEKRFKVGDKVVIKKDFEEYYRRNKKTSSRDIHTIEKINYHYTPNYYYSVDKWWIPHERSLEYALIGGKIDGKKI